MTEPRLQTASRTQRAAILGLLVNVGLATAKLLAGVLGHSYALIADAAESLTDIAGSAIIWGGLRIGSRPADESHPYGHGKAEAVAGLVVACLIAATGLGIAVAAVREILTPHHAPAPFTLVVLVVVMAIKETLFRYARAVARKARSGAVEVDAWHHRADAITSAAAFLGISAALLGPRLFGGTPDAWAPADDWAALVAAGIILFNAWSILQGPLRELMDTDPGAYDPEVLEHARRAALAVPGVRAIEKTLARKLGARYWLDMHLEVDPHMTVADAHVITGKVKAAIRAATPSVADVLIHVEPHAE